MENKITPRIAGAAFLLQAIASAVANLVLLDTLVVSDSITESMNNFSNIV